MKWIFLTMFFLSVGDIFGESCRKRLNNECKFTDPPRRFPENKDELDHACNYGLKMTSCVANVVENCEEEEEEEEGEEIQIRRLSKDFAARAKQTVSSLETVCDRESRNYIAISNNIECISSTVDSKDEMCDWRTISEKRRNLSIAYAAKVHHREMLEPDSIYHYCARLAFEIACNTGVISDKCGSEIIQPVLQTLMELDKFNLDAVCPEEIIAEIPMFTFAYAMVEKEAEHATNELEKPMQAPSYSDLIDEIMDSFK